MTSMRLSCPTRTLILPPQNNAAKRSCLWNSRIIRHLWKWEKIGCNILCGLALWEQMQDCDRRGVPYTDIDIEAVSQDVAYRLMMSHDRLYALALYEWTEQHFAQNSDTSDAAAGENGCDFPTHNNST